MVLPIDVKKTNHYLSDQLAINVGRIYNVNQDLLWGLNPDLNLHTAQADLPLVAEEMRMFYRENLGQIPAIYDGNADDIPTVDVSVGSRTVKAAMFALASKWNILQLEKERLNAQINNNVPGFNLVAAQQDAVAEFFNKGEHYTVLYGYPKIGIRGIFSQQNSARVDATFTPYVKAANAFTMTTATLYDDLVSIIYAFMSRARLSSPAQVEMKVPPALGRRLVELYVNGAGVSTNMTVRGMLQSVDFGMGIAKIDVHNELQGSELNKYVPNESGTAMYATTNDRIVLKATTMPLERHYYPRTPFPSHQRSTLEWEQITLGATTGIISSYPESIWYYDFSNAIA